MMEMIETLHVCKCDTILSENRAGYKHDSAADIKCSCNSCQITSVSTEHVQTTLTSDPVSFQRNHNQLWSCAWERNVLFNISSPNHCFKALQFWPKLEKNAFLLWCSNEDPPVRHNTTTFKIKKAQQMLTLYFTNVITIERIFSVYVCCGFWNIGGID